MKHLLLLRLFLLISLSLLSLVSSQPCTANLTATLTDVLISFNTSTLKCLSALPSANFTLRYGSTGAGLWSFVLSAPNPDSYIAVGFSADGEMVGSSAVAGWISDKGTGIVKQYKLNGKSSKNNLPDTGDLKLVHGQTHIISESSRLHVTFQFNSSGLPPPYLIFSVGPSGVLPSLSNYLLPFHSSKLSISVNYTAAVVLDTASSDSKGSSSALPPERQHALLVILGFGVLLPMGLILPRYFKGWEVMWFYFHLVIQILGFGLGLAGFIIGLGLDSSGIDHFLIHKSFGITILVCVCLQVTSLLARPDKKAKVRKYWNWNHHYIGRIAIAFAIGNVFLGLSIAGEVQSWLIGYGVFLGVWLLACSLLEIRTYLVNSKDHD